MPKICAKENCNNPVWSHNFCKYHQNIRWDSAYFASLERARNKIPVKAIVCTTSGSAFLKTPLKSKIRTTGESALFDAIWKTRPHISFVSNKTINIEYHSDLWFSLFAHVLSKGTYPNFRLLDKNIQLLLPEEHTLYDQGTEEKRQKYAQACENEGGGCDWQKLFDLQEELKHEYNKKTRL